MEHRRFGDTGLEIAPLGYGSAEIGIAETPDEQVREILSTVLDAGINVLDTAACYGESEAMIGRTVADRRDEYVLVTKCGHGRDDLEPAAWTAEIVTASIERSLRRLKTDRLDLVLLHSCPVETLKNDELLEALSRAKKAGKTRLIGYSGDGEDADFAVGLDLFDALETSLNVADQQCLDGYLPKAAEKGLGILVKRPIANSAWRQLEEMHEFYSDYARPYAERIGAMDLNPKKVGFDGPWIEMALRFSAWQCETSTAIVGSTNPEHIRENVRIVEKGPLPSDVVENIRRLFREHDDGSWVGQT